MFSFECIIVYKYFYYIIKSIREFEMIILLILYFWGGFFFYLSFIKKCFIDFYYFCKIFFLKFEKCIVSFYNIMFYKYNYILYIYVIKIN